MKSQNFNVNKYVDQMSLLIDLPIPDEYRHGVVANFTRIKAIAQLVNSFPVPEEIEAAPSFQPWMMLSLSLHLFALVRLVP